MSFLAKSALAGWQRLLPLPLVLLLLVARESRAFSTSLSSPCRRMLHQQQQQYPHGVPFSTSVTSSSGPSREVSTKMGMALVPLPTEELEQLLSVGPPTGEQYATYMGRTPQERYGRILESSIVTVLGMFFSYFLSFVMGGFVATILGTLFFFWGILSPQLKAAQRNWEFLGGRRLVDPWKVAPPADGDNSSSNENNAGLYGALYLGFIDDVCVVEKSSDTREYDLDDFMDYTMETDELEQYTGEPYLLRVRLRDSKGRELQIHTRMSEEYLDVQPQMPAVAILLSTRGRKFDQLAAISDLYIPDAETWIGDYPYLNRVETQSLLAEDDEIWEIIEQEAAFVVAEQEASAASWDPTEYKEAKEIGGGSVDEVDDDDPYVDDPSDQDYGGLSAREKVRLKRKGRRI